MDPWPGDLHSFFENEYYVLPRIASTFFFPGKSRPLLSADWDRSVRASDRDDEYLKIILLSTIFRESKIGAFALPMIVYLSAWKSVSSKLGRFNNLLRSFKTNCRRNFRRSKKFILISILKLIHICLISTKRMEKCSNKFKLNGTHLCKERRKD